MTKNKVGRIVVDAAINVHKGLGPGLLESCLRDCTCWVTVETRVADESSGSCAYCF